MTRNHTFDRHSGAEHRHGPLRLPLSDDGKTIHHLVLNADFSLTGP